MSYFIGAKDNIERALVKHYSGVQTCNFDNEKIKPDDVLRMIDMLSMTQKNYHLKKVS